MKVAHIFGILFIMINKEKLLQPDYSIVEPGYQGKIEIDFSDHLIEIELHRKTAEASLQRYIRIGGRELI